MRRWPSYQDPHCECWTHLIHKSGILFFQVWKSWFNFWGDNKLMQEGNGVFMISLSDSDWAKPLQHQPLWLPFLFWQKNTMLQDHFLTWQVNCCSTSETLHREYVWTLWANEDDSDETGSIIQYVMQHGGNCTWVDTDILTDTFLQCWGMKPHPALLRRTGNHQARPLPHWYDRYWWGPRHCSTDWF